MNTYRINFKGLKEGQHQFSFDVTDDFFSQFEKSEIEKGNLNAEVALTKTSSLLSLEIGIQGSVFLTCDRCLEEFTHDIDFSGELFVKFGQEDEIDDNVLQLDPEASELDLAQYFYESIHLSLPIKRVHPDDENGNSTCDPEMLKKLNQHKVKDDSDDDTIDPRWNELKKLMDN